ncbi:DUF4261 domain-containing protein [Saccharibacillus alkalitolerans]|uniref:DUF4261 domain-containing protein n=1 Tax=Saccharibacillus alkalitolerans TaxID=2705290 RepID=A0ABX0F314_9BACL|nr:DUF4261 domain-containing protein [Saccharibacillus alkalitolerans]NGZ74043.1 DUF4261 domain-containing protein [Saccharibacillus alkalitolerans]
MSFFTKWFKKGKEEEEAARADAAGRTTEEQSDPPRRPLSESASRDWTRIPENRPGTKTFSRHILLRSPELAPSGFAKSLREREPDVRGGIHEGRVIVHYRDMTVTAELEDAPLPNREAEENGKYNAMWPDAEAAIEGYTAHMRVTAMNVEDSVEGHKLMTKLIASLLEHMPSALAVYSAPMLVSRAAYIASADMLAENMLPVNLWVFVGLYGGEGKGSSYTHGMQDFGGDELELLNTQRSAAETFELMFSVAAYSIERRIRFQGGENIAFKEGEALTLTRSPGVALQGMTMKVEGF